MSRGQKRPFATCLDAEQRLIRWPKGQALRQAALAHLAGKFTLGHTYNEAAVNELLRSWHLFNDPAMLRRALFDYGYLDRTRDGSQYWRLASHGFDQASGQL